MTSSNIINPLRQREDGRNVVLPRFYQGREAGGNSSMSVDKSINSGINRSKAFLERRVPRLEGGNSLLLDNIRLGLKGL